MFARYPEDKKDENGVKFWSGTKRAPKPLVFDLGDETCLNYVIAAANLRAFNFGLAPSTDRKEFVRLLPSVVVPEFVVSTQVKIAANDEELKKMQAEMALADDHDETVRKLVATLPDRAGTLASLTITPVEFEKDDDTNFHMDFITAQATAQSTRRIRGYVDALEVCVCVCVCVCATRTRRLLCCWCWGRLAGLGWRGCHSRTWGGHSSQLRRNSTCGSRNGSRRDKW